MNKIIANIHRRLFQIYFTDLVFLEDFKVKNCELLFSPKCIFKQPQILGQNTTILHFTVVEI